MEKAIEKALKRHVEALGGLCMKFSSPGVAGVPDRICLLPAGRIVFVELKQPGKKARPLQDYRMRQIRDRGFEVVVIDSIDQIKEVIS